MSTDMSDVRRVIDKIGGSLRRMDTNGTPRTAYDTLDDLVTIAGEIHETQASHSDEVTRDLDDLVAEAQAIRLGVEEISAVMTTLVDVFGSIDRSLVRIAEK